MGQVGFSAVLLKSRPRRWCIVNFDGAKAWRRKREATKCKKRGYIAIDSIRDGCYFFTTNAAFYETEPTAFSSPAYVGYLTL